MLNTREEREIASRFLNDISNRYDIELCVYKELEFKEGVLFVAQSKEFVETGDFAHFLIGSKPFIVDKIDKSIFQELNEVIGVDELIKRFKKYKEYK